jgi:hypothetical protein
LSLSTAIGIAVAVQVASFCVLCPLLWAQGTWNLAAAQGLLAIVTLFVYWPWA